MTGTARLAALAVALLAAAAGPTSAPERAAERDRCPVCGMFVAKFPDWQAQVVFAGGRRVFFDGAKDLFRYLADPGSYGGRDRAGDVAAVFVTDYYTLEPVEGRTASYVLGSDVLGPMGAELIPFDRREAAEEFLRDHRGERVLGYEEALGEIGRFFP